MACLLFWKGPAGAKGAHAHHRSASMEQVFACCPKRCYNWHLYESSQYLGTQKELAGETVLKAGRKPSTVLQSWCFFRLTQWCQIHSPNQISSSASDNAAFSTTFHQYVLMCFAQILSERTMVPLKSLLCWHKIAKQLHSLILVIFWSGLLASSLASTASKDLEKLTSLKRSRV